MLYDLHNNDLQTKIKYLEEREFTEQEFLTVFNSGELFL